MSEFKVEKTTISKTIPIDGADRVELAQVDGKTYQFVVGKGQFTIGSPCIYFPIDSVLTQPLIDHFGISKFLSGKEHNRVKTTRFLKQISQGYVSSIESVKQYLGDEFEENTIDFTELLGVIKYEAPQMLVKNAKLIPLDMPAYDIEGVSNYQSVVDFLMDKDVVISEKVEGMNAHLTLKANGEIKIGQRNFYIISNDTENPHSFETVGKRDVLPLAQKLQLEKFPNSDIRIRFEFLGESSQGNYYQFRGHVAKIFEIDVNGKSLDAIVLIDLIKEYNINFVPILHVGKLSDFLNGKTIQEVSNGKSQLVDRLREGIVVRTFKNEYNKDLDSRLIIKHRSSEYLAKTDY